MHKPLKDQFQFSLLQQSPTRTASEQSIVPHKGPNPKSLCRLQTTNFYILYESTVVLRERWKKMFLIDWEEGFFGLLYLSHLNKSHVKVTCFIFPSNLTVKQMLGCKV